MKNKKLSKRFIKFLAKSRLCAKYIAEKSPFMLSIAEFFLLNVPLFLPHDNDYYGFLKLTNKKRGLFLDVGADDGRSILSFHKLKRYWDIFSIEANPLHIPELRRVKSKVPRLKFIIGAVDKTSGKKITLYIPIYRFWKLHGATSTDLEFSKRTVESYFGKNILNKIRFKKITANTIRIDDLKLSPDIIKMDVEGAELNALLGCVNTIKRCSPSFLIEYKGYNKDFKKILEFFQARSYTPYGFDPKNMNFAKFSGDKFRNCFFIPNNKNG